MIYSFLAQDHTKFIFHLILENQSGQYRLLEIESTFHLNMQE